MVALDHITLAPLGATPQIPSRAARHYADLRFHHGPSRLAGRSTTNFLLPAARG